MYTLKRIKELRKACRELQLEDSEILEAYSDRELKAICNGIGPDAFPAWLRKFISALHPSLAPVAMIHDVEWHESDKSREKFAESNARFKRNGRKVAEAQFCFVNPRRYIVWNQARRFGNYCQLFGWEAWAGDCACAVCRKRREKEAGKGKAKNA